MYAPDDSLLFACLGAGTQNRPSLTWIASVGEDMQGLIAGIGRVEGAVLRDLDSILAPARVERAGHEVLSPEPLRPKGRLATRCWTVPSADGT